MAATAALASLQSAVPPQSAPGPHRTASARAAPLSPSGDQGRALHSVADLERRRLAGDKSHPPLNRAKPCLGWLSCHRILPFSKTCRQPVLPRGRQLEAWFYAGRGFGGLGFT